MDVQITNKPEFEKTLTRLVDILHDNAFTAQANVVRHLFDALTRNDTQDFLKIITSVDMWGGSGAVWEVGGFTTSKDEKEFWRHLIRLTDEMKAVGIKCGRAYETADIFRGELKKTGEL